MSSRRPVSRSTLISRPNVERVVRDVDLDISAKTPREHEKIVDDLMNQINARGTYLVSKTCIPHLKKAANPHILMLSPPLDMKARWFEHSTAYTMAKFGMSMCVLGMAEEFKDQGVAFNAHYLVWADEAVNAWWEQRGVPWTETSSTLLGPVWLVPTTGSPSCELPSPFSSSRRRI